MLVYFPERASDLFFNALGDLVHIQATYSGFPVMPIAFRCASRNLQSGALWANLQSAIALA
jgi:hypothetical protein